MLALSGAAIVLTRTVARLRSEAGRLAGDKLSLEGSVRQLSGDRNSLQSENGELIHERKVLNTEISKTRLELDQSNIAAAHAARDAAWQMNVPRAARELLRSPTTALEQVRLLLREQPNDPTSIEPRRIMPKDRMARQSAWIPALRNW